MSQVFSRSERRRSIRLSYANGGLWALGNGLVSTSLVTYLAFELDAPGIGLGIGALIAAPRIVGLLRLGAPLLIGRVASRKRFCIGSYLAGALTLLLLPVICAPQLLPSAVASLTALVVLWSLFHLMEYLGTIALWSWLADLAPTSIRGRFLGIRQRWMVAGGLVGMLVSGTSTYASKQILTRGDWWQAYAYSAIGGTLVMLLALMPLRDMVDPPPSRPSRESLDWRKLVRPFMDNDFRRLLMFGCWFSICNGLTQSIQFIYPARVLGFTLFAILALRSMMRCGQMVVSPTMGRLADSAGNKKVLIVSQLLVALGPLMFVAASPEQPHAENLVWIGLAWVMWVFYAGINVALPNLMLKMSPQQDNAPYIASYYAISGLCLAVSTLLGGHLFDRWGETTFALGANWTCGYFTLAFLLAWLARSCGVFFLLAIREPKQQR